MEQAVVAEHSDTISVLDARARAEAELFALREDRREQTRLSVVGQQALAKLR